MYHDIYSDDHAGYSNIGKSATSYHVSLSRFQEHISMYEQHGLKFISQTELNNNASNNAVLVTFDDGWLGSLTVGADFLESKSIPAVYFITTNFIGMDYFANAKEIQQAHSRGFIIGSHGVTHRMLSSLDATEIKKELSESKKILEDIISDEVICFSLPGGAGDKRVYQIAEELGYQYIYTSEIAINPTRKGIRRIARVGLMDKTSDETIHRWSGFDVAKEWRKKAVLSVPKNLLGMKNYSKLRRLILGETKENHYFKP